MLYQLRAIPVSAVPSAWRIAPLPQRRFLAPVIIALLGASASPLCAVPPAQERSALRLSYTDALSRIETSNPALRLQTLRAERDRKAAGQHATFLPASPELEVSMDRGSIQYPPGYFEQLPASESHKLRGYEVGLRQQVDLSGLRSKRRDAAEKQSVLSEHLIKSEALLARGRVRRAYLATTVHGGMAEHLGEHIVRFTRLKATIGRGYFDRRLGAYTSSALDMGIASIESDRSENDTARRMALIVLRSELALSGDDPLQLDDYRKIPLADIPDDSRLAQLAEKGLPLTLGEDRVGLAKAEEEFAKRKIFPFVELFGAMGKRDLGAFSSPYFSNNAPQREDYLRLGFRVPLSVAGPDRLAKDVAATESRMAEEELNVIRSHLRRQVQTEAETYRLLRQRYDLLMQTFTRSEPMLEAMEEALILRRITYFEFWSEHERLHDILKKVGETRLKAADALGRLEILTGTEF